MCSLPTMNLIAPLGVGVRAAVDASASVDSRRRTFLLLIPHVQGSNDIELPIRARDLIQHFSRDRRRRHECKIDNPTLDQFRPGHTGRSRFSTACGSRCRRGRSAVFFGQRLAMKSGHTIDPRVGQNIHEQLRLREFLAEQRSGRGVRQRSGEFIKAEMKIVRQFHFVRARLVGGLNRRLPQTRLKFVRRKRSDGKHLRF